MYQRNSDQRNRRPLPPQNRRQDQNAWREPPREEERPPQERTTRRPRPPSQRQRDSRRQDAFRDNNPKTKQAQKDIEDRINKELYFGFGDAITAEKQVDFAIQKTAAIVPVTTRAVGFYSQWLFKKIYELYGRRPDRVPECTPYAFYRVSLAQYEYRLLCGRSAQVNTLGIDAGLFYRPRLTIEERDVIKAMAVTFSPLTNLIAGIGNFEYEGEAYYVKCPDDYVLGILFSNLRTIVERISNPATPQAERQRFYDLNPLPFAAWNQPQRAGVRRRADGQIPADPGFPLLLNPGDFMPDGYDIDDFERDVHRVKNFISFVARKEIKLMPC